MKRDNESLLILIMLFVIIFSFAIFVFCLATKIGTDVKNTTDYGVFGKIKED